MPWWMRCTRCCKDGWNNIDPNCPKCSGTGQDWRTDDEYDYAKRMADNNGVELHYEKYIPGEGSGCHSDDNTDNSSSNTSTDSEGDNSVFIIFMTLVILVGAVGIFLKIYHDVVGTLTRSATRHRTTIEHEFWMHILSSAVGVVVTVFWTIGIPWFVSHKLKDKLNVDWDEDNIQSVMFTITFLVQVGFLFIEPTKTFLRSIFYSSIR